MKVQLREQKKHLTKEMKKVWHLKLFIWMTADFLGIFPLKIDKETFLFSFKWLSTKTLFSFLRLALFNIPLTILPVALFLLNFKEEWGSSRPPWMDEGNGTITTQEVVFYGEYVCNYSYYILSQLQNVWGKTGKDLSFVPFLALHFTQVSRSVSCIFKLAWL